MSVVKHWDDELLARRMSALCEVPFGSWLGSSALIETLNMSIAMSEWGPEGARRFNEQAGAIIVVDVLSFSTCVDIAVARRASVYPFPYGDRSAAKRMAMTLGAEVAGPRGSSEYRFSLPPTSVRHRGRKQARVAKPEWCFHLRGSPYRAGSCRLPEECGSSRQEGSGSCAGYRDRGHSGRRTLA
jgi:hypothetical protein